MSEAESRHQRHRRWRTLSEFLVLGALAALCTMAAVAEGAVIRRPLLSQDLQDTPKGFQCMKSLVESAVGDKVRAFRGPFYGKESDGSDNPRIAVFEVIAEGSTEPSGSIRFFTPPPHRWRYFTYGDPMQTKIGMYAAKMMKDGEYHDGQGRVVRLDYEVCLKYLGRSISEH